jgi:hypothetical protein
MLGIDLKILLGKAGARLNLKTRIESLHIHPDLPGTITKYCSSLCKDVGVGNSCLVTIYYLFLATQLDQKVDRNLTFS